RIRRPLEGYLNAECGRQASGKLDVIARKPAVCAARDVGREVEASRRDNEPAPCDNALHIRRERRRPPFGGGAAGDQGEGGGGGGGGGPHPGAERPPWLPRRPGGGGA